MIACILYIINTHSVAEVSIPTELTVAEDEGTVQVCATLVIVITDASSEFAVVEFAITVNLATHNGTGIVIRSSYYA